MIVSTPFYITPEDKVNVKMWDDEENRWCLTEMTFDGVKIHWEDIDPKSEWQGLNDELNFLTELLDHNFIKFISK